MTASPCVDDQAVGSAHEPALIGVAGADNAARAVASRRHQNFRRGVLGPRVALHRRLVGNDGGLLAVEHRVALLDQRVGARACAVSVYELAVDAHRGRGDDGRDAGRALLRLAVARIAVARIAVAGIAIARLAAARLAVVGIGVRGGRREVAVAVDGDALPRRRRREGAAEHLGLCTARSWSW